MSDIKQLISDLNTQYGILVEQKEKLRPVWQDLASNFMPLSRPALEETISIEEIYQSFGSVNDDIYDPTPIAAVKVAASGMQAGMTSPAQKWFKLGHRDTEAEKQPEVKAWLEEVQNVLFSVMARSNFYNSTYEVYEEIPVFGIAVMLIESDVKEVIRCTVLTIGDFVLSADSNRKRNTLFREFVMTAKQLVEKFGENVSKSVSIAAKQESTKNSVFSVIHAIFPNKDRNGATIDAGNKPFRSIYYEKDAIGKALSIGGFDTLPFVSPRWGVARHSVYGTSPAMDMLSFAKQLQAMSLTLLEAAQKEIDPPLNVPPGHKRVSLVPGALNRTSDTTPITPTISVQSRPQQTMLVIQDLRKEIREGLFNDLFKALAVASKVTMTATEVRERVIEGLKLLGPVLERLQHEFLGPTIDRVFDICLKSGLFPEIPEVLEGEELKVEYISPLAQAQKAEGAGALNQFMAIISQVSQLSPEILDTVNFDELASKYAELLGIPPKIMESKKEIQDKRQARAEVQQRAEQEETEKNTVNSLKTLSETQVGGGANALEVATEGVA